MATADDLKLLEERGYLVRSLDQAVYGKRTGEVTLLGTAMQFGLGFTGMDAPADIRDLRYDIKNWEWSWAHAGETAFDAAALLPGVGAGKSADEVAVLAKKGDKAAKSAGKIDPKLAELHKKLDTLAEENLLPEFRKIDPNLEAGYTGSFKTGTVGNPNKSTYGQPIDLNSYDIDYYIKSDKLYEMYGSSIKANPQFREILSQTPGFEGLKANKAGFSIKFLSSN